MRLFFAMSLFHARDRVPLPWERGGSCGPRSLNDGAHTRVTSFSCPSVTRRGRRKLWFLGSSSEPPGVLWGRPVGGQVVRRSPSPQSCFILMFYISTLQVSFV